MDKLGFGMMRLPMPDPNQQEKIDFEQVCSMVDTSASAALFSESAKRASISASFC